MPDPVPPPRHSMYNHLYVPGCIPGSPEYRAILIMRQSQSTGLNNSSGSAVQAPRPAGPRPVMGVARQIPDAQLFLPPRNDESFFSFKWLKSVYAKVILFCFVLLVTANFFLSAQIMNHLFLGLFYAVLYLSGSGVIYTFLNLVSGGSFERWRGMFENAQDLHARSAVNYARYCVLEFFNMLYEYVMTIAGMGIAEYRGFVGLGRSMFNGLSELASLVKQVPGTLARMAMSTEVYKSVARCLYLVWTWLATANAMAIEPLILLDVLILLVIPILVAVFVAVWRQVEYTRFGGFCSWVVRWAVWFFNLGWNISAFLMGPRGRIADTDVVLPGAFPDTPPPPPPPGNAQTQRPAAPAEPQEPAAPSEPQEPTATPSHWTKSAASTGVRPDAPKTSTGVRPDAPRRRPVLSTKACSLFGQFPKLEDSNLLTTQPAKTKPVPEKTLRSIESKAQAKTKPVPEKSLRSVVSKAQAKTKPVPEKSLRSVVSKAQAKTKPVPEKPTRSGQSLLHTASSDVSVAPLNTVTAADFTDTKTSPAKTKPEVEVPTKTSQPGQYPPYTATSEGLEAPINTESGDTDKSSRSGQFPQTAISDVSEADTTTTAATESPKTAKLRQRKQGRVFRSQNTKPEGSKGRSGRQTRFKKTNDSVEFSGTLIMSSSEITPALAEVNQMIVPTVTAADPSVDTPMADSEEVAELKVRIAKMARDLREARESEEAEAKLQASPPKTVVKPASGIKLRLLLPARSRAPLTASEDQDVLMADSAPEDFDVPMVDSEPEDFDVQMAEAAVEDLDVLMGEAAIASEEMGDCVMLDVGVPSAVPLRKLCLPTPIPRPPPPPPPARAVAQTTARTSTAKVATGRVQAPQERKVEQQAPVAAGNASTLSAVPEATTSATTENSATAAGGTAPRRDLTDRERKWLAKGFALEPTTSIARLEALRVMARETVGEIRPGLLTGLQENVLIRLWMGQHEGQGRVNHIPKY